VERAIEALGEFQLGLVAEQLVAKHEHRVLMHTGPQGSEDCGIGEPGQGDPRDFGDKQRMQWTKLQGHDGLPVRNEEAQAYAAARGRRNAETGAPKSRLPL
jgi:hypothetical protein